MLQQNIFLFASKKTVLQGSLLYGCVLYQNKKKKNYKIYKNKENQRPLSNMFKGNKLAHGVYLYFFKP